MSLSISVIAFIKGSTYESAFSDSSILCTIVSIADASSSGFLVSLPIDLEQPLVFSLKKPYL